METRITAEQLTKSILKSVRKGYRQGADAILDRAYQRGAEAKTSSGYTSFWKEQSPKKEYTDSDNPYPVGSKEHKSFENGWRKK